MLSRLPLILLAMGCLVTGVWGGLTRLHWSPVPVTTFNVNWATFHGPLMVCGFLGTLVGVERAVALQRWWAAIGPLATALGGLLLIVGVIGSPAAWLFVVGGASLFTLTSIMAMRHRTAYLLVMAGGGGLWLIGNLLWLDREPLHQVVPWWIGFLLLTIVAERLELSRFLLLTGWQLGPVYVALGGFAAGLAAGLEWPVIGHRVAGLGLLAIAVWLLRFDAARRTVRQPGPPRFTAVCLLSGYVWLAVAGLLWSLLAPLPKYGGAYDAVLHAFFLGFAFTMIFGHAPIVLPAVLGVTLPYSRMAYLHVGLLHVGLAMRVIGDLAGVPRLNGWGGLLNATALALFVVHTVVSVARSSRTPK